MSGVDDEDNSDLEGEEAESSEEDVGAIDDEFEEELDDDDAPFEEADVDLKVVDEALSHKDQNARALAIRRAIEERLESKRMSRDLDYLDLDLDSDD